MAHWITDKDGKRIKVAGNYGKKPDDFLSVTSENAVQNKVVAEAINGLQTQFNNKKIELIKLTASGLWSSGNYSAQEVSVQDLYNYDLIFIFFRSGTGNSYYDDFVPAKVELNRSYAIVGVPSDTVFYRKFSFTSNGISFKDCTQIYPYGSTTTNNGAMLPFGIYGVK